ncbi:MAG: ribonuclease III [Myxococcota bacterium]
MSDDAVRDLETATGHRFADADLARTSLSHPSHAHELDGTRGNERLEFLGDAVLDLVVSRVLYERHPDWAEGELTRVRSSLVNKRALADQARALGLDALVRLGRTEQRNRGYEKDSILANCFEAVLGALYLDGGLPAVEPLVERCIGEALARGPVARDAKTALNEWAHAERGQPPRYRLVDDSGVDDADDRFTVEVVIDDEFLGRGVGRTKRAAETAAAEAGLARTEGGG